MRARARLIFRCADGMTCRVHELIVEWSTDRKIDMDSLITPELPLARINEAFDLMHDGQSIHTDVEFTP